MLIRSISGVRGLTKNYLTPELSISYARALHSFLPDGVIMSGRDSRPSGEDIAQAMMNELNRLGRTIIEAMSMRVPVVASLSRLVIIQLNGMV